jgi:hypothetical protein
MVSTPCETVVVLDRECNLSQGVNPVSQDFPEPSIVFLQQGQSMDIGESTVPSTNETPTTMLTMQ